jgi:hypothetical protein
MAKIVTESVVITFSKIIKDTVSDVSDIANADIQAALEQVAQELVGDGVVVEVVRA